MFSLYNLYKICDPGEGQIWPQGQNFYKIGSRLLGNATY